MILHPTPAPVRRAIPADVPAVLHLLDLCYDPGGRGLSQRFTAPQVAGFVQAFPCMVAGDADDLRGVLLAQPLPSGEELGPVTAAMLRAFPPAPDAFVYGPIAVAPQARGTGLSGRLGAALLQHLPGRTGLLFINAGNAPSLRAHRAMGVRELGAFTWNGVRFLCFAYGGPDYA